MHEVTVRCVDLHYIITNLFGTLCGLFKIINYLLDFFRRKGVRYTFIFHKRYR